MDGSNGDIYYVWLALKLGPKNPHSLELLIGFDSIDDLYECTCYSRFGLPSILEERLLDKDLTDAIKTVERCRKVRAGILTYGSDLYPQRMKLLRTVPPVLYYIGEPRDLNGEVCVTFVGTRHASENGLLTAEQMAFGCAKSGITVVSGLAAGIDRACHRGALLAEKYTVGFSGVSIDRIYPKSNTDLYFEMYKKGVVFSEYPPGADSGRFSFPERNRLLSAVSLGVVVIEAPAKSGSIITAELAKGSGKMVFAVPGDIKTSPGTNSLIADGATVVQSYKDVVKEYEYLYQDKIRTAEYIDDYFPIIQRDFSEFSKQKKETLHIKIDKAEKTGSADKSTDDGNPGAAEIDTEEYDDGETAVIMILKEHKALTMDDILSISNDPFDKVIAALTMLEIRGKVERDENGLYILSR